MAAEGSRRTRPNLVAVPADEDDGPPDETGSRTGSETPGDRSDRDDQSGDHRRTSPDAESGPSGEHAPDADDAEPERLSDVDEWGRSQHLRDLLAQLYDPIYDKWFRVEWEGFEKIPREGGALMVANHAGAIPADAPSIMHGIERELGRPVYGLADEMFKKVPVVNLAWSRLGGVQAHPDNAYRLLREQQHLVLVFPEGSKGPGKTYAERYRLRRFGRGGFVQIAMRAGVPIIPLAIVGSEETMPILTKVPAVARLLGLPYAPITANMLLGPLGALVPFPAKIRIRVLDPVHLDVLPDQPRYSRSRIMDTSEGIRNAIQEELYDMLRRRHSVWFG
ncbi:MAG: acyltransferase family protein [Acidimicrobiales bacterium]|nr:acyltransferase family protein [Acidimicrobiales bacterium]